MQRVQIVAKSDKGCRNYRVKNHIALIKNNEGFRADVKLGKQLGYTGKSVVHPNQIGMVHELYTPTIKEIESAKEILNAYEDALKNASGVTSLNGKMIDKPMVTRAMSILSYAKAAGMEV